MTRLQCFHVASVATYTASQHIGRSLTPRLHHVHFKLSSFKASMYHSNRLIGYILSNTVVVSPKYGCGVVACGRIEVFVDAYRRRSLPMIVHVNIRPSNTNIEFIAQHEIDYQLSIKFSVRINVIAFGRTTIYIFFNSIPDGSSTASK